MMSHPYPKFVKVVEVGPRDGLQNVDTIIPTEVKRCFIEKLSTSGLKTIEAASFVSPRWVPQMADSEQLMKSCRREPGVKYTALTPNLKGFEKAVAAQMDEVAVFAAASETFSKNNINCTIAQSLELFEPLIEQAKQQCIPVRGYVSCALGCPYEKEVPAARVAQVAESLYSLGCYEVAISDTTGVGTEKVVVEVMEAVLEKVPVERIAVHFHDTYGQALNNICTAMRFGVSVVDSATAGLGGCPYAKGASGNVSTENLLYMLHGMGIETGVSLDNIVEAGRYITEAAGIPNRSLVGLAKLAK